MLGLTGLRTSIDWIPAYAGMTNATIPCPLLYSVPFVCSPFVAFDTPDTFDTFDTLSKERLRCQSDKEDH
jgi:hypothetical protein